MTLMSKAKSKDFWESVRTEDKYQRIVSIIRGYYEQNHTDTIEPLGYALRMRYERDGNRSEFEAYYFRRRNYMCSAALMALIYPDEPKYLDELHEIIWAICEEYCWVLPAHVSFSEYGDNDFIDLFAAETAFSLAEIRYMLEDRLESKIKERIQESLEWRILRNIERGPMAWEDSDNNWSAVVGGGVGGTLMYAFPKKFDEYLSRLLDTLKCFLNGYSDDGVCFEGLGYWHYGFGSFTWFADLLYQYTDGKVDLFDNAKVELCAAYGQRNFIKGNSTISFSDTTRTGAVDACMQNYLAERYPESIYPLPDSITTEVWAGNLIWMRLLRALYYLNNASAPTDLKVSNYYLPHAGQVIINNTRYSLVVKAGHNDECTGHNDVGNFILSTNQGQIFSDIGSGVYNREYFNGETRYEIFCNGSQGHSVPIINGKHQKYGREHSGTMNYADNEIKLEISGAYGLPGFDRLERKFDYEEDRVALTDSFDPDYESITERFITLIEPVVCDDQVQIGDTVMKYDPECAEVSVSSVEHHVHGSDDGEIVYCLDFKLKQGLERVKFEIIINR